MLIQKFQNFAHSSLNSPFTQIDTNIEKKYIKRNKKSKKPVRGVCSSQDWSQNPLAKRDLFYKSNVLSKHPEMAKNAFKV